MFKLRKVFTTDRTVIIFTNPQTVRKKVAAGQTLPFLWGRVAHFHGPRCRMRGLEHTPKIKFAGETFWWLCFDLIHFHLVCRLFLSSFDGWAGRRLPAVRCARARSGQRKACCSCGLLLRFVKHQPCTLPSFLLSPSACCHLCRVGAAAAASWSEQLTQQKTHPTKIGVQVVICPICMCFGGLWIGCGLVLWS